MQLATLPPARCGTPLQPSAAHGAILRRQSQYSLREPTRATGRVCCRVGCLQKQLVHRPKVQPPVRDSKQTRRGTKHGNGSRCEALLQRGESVCPSLAARLHAPARRTGAGRRARAQNSAARTLCGQLRVMPFTAVLRGSSMQNAERGANVRARAALAARRHRHLRSVR
eukprot:6212299-Pleurochrysis_carterae.AAC.5